MSLRHFEQASFLSSHKKFTTKATLQETHEASLFMEASNDKNGWSIQNMLGINKASAKSPAEASAATPNGKEKGGYEVNRYQHDLLQAKAMRRGIEKSKSQKEFSDSDIVLGLNGLEEADSLQSAGDFSEALKVSELSMQLLIGFLKSDASILPEVHRETISQRVQVALTNAEQMKQALQSKAQSNKTSKPLSQSAQKMSEALSGAIDRARNATDRRQSPQQPTSSKQRASASPQISHRQQNRTQKLRSPRHALDSNDPMVQTIKSELYVDPSQLQQISWDDVAGLDTAKQALQENAILPLVRPDLFTKLRKPRNILLYGPPGTGKTMLVKAVAKESNCILFICTASSLTSKWHGEGEKLLRTLFQVARAAAPSIIFIDEMDALLSSRKSDGEHEASRRFKTEFMTQVDGIQKDGSTNDSGHHLLVIGCTNCPWDIDSAVLRRFPRRICIPLPDTNTRSSLLKKLLRQAGSHNLGSSDRKAIVKKLHGFSGSDIASIASEASFGPLRDIGGVDKIRGAKAKDIRPISKADFEAAIAQSTKSVTKNVLQQYQDWQQQQGAS